MLFGEGIQTSSWRRKEGKIMERVCLKSEENKVEDITHRCPYSLRRGKWGVRKNDPFEVIMAKMTNTREDSWISKHHWCVDMLPTCLWETSLKKNTWHPESVMENWMTGPFQGCWLVGTVGKAIWSQRRWLCSEMSAKNWQWGFSLEERKNVLLLMESRIKQILPKEKLWNKV